ncbi:hypothetical protein VARIO8X_60404 [Burkholderiales bacterium 8X]|nr:hypothetical protein VARIO8X_60404 [Burkholderiales bacterium 8X]
MSHAGYEIVVLRWNCESTTIDAKQGLDVLSYRHKESRVRRSALPQRHCFQTLQSHRPS